jgi:hypothetical protein
MVDGRGTQGDHLGFVLLLPEAPAAAPPMAPPTASPDSQARTLVVLLLPEHLLHADAQNEYHEGIRDEMTW